MTRRISGISRLGALLLCGLHLLTGCMLDTTGLGTIPDAQPNSYACACRCRNPVRTSTLQVSASADDAEEDLGSGAVDLTSSDLELAVEGGPQLVAVRFRDVGIPRNATVLSAHLQFTTDEVSAGAVNLNLRGEAADNAPVFLAADGNLSTRPLTAAAVPWSPVDWPTVGEAAAAQRTPNLQAIVQEIVNRPGWVVGNAIVITLSGTGTRVADSFDGSADGAPRLVLEYEEPGVDVSLQACMTPELNPNLGNDNAPTLDELRADCQDRIQETLTGLNGACGYPSLCTCDVSAGTERFANNCNSTCSEVPLSADCSNFNPEGGTVTATNVPGDLPTCIATSPISSGVFGRRSRCEVSGQALIEAEDETRTPGAHGVVEILGGPCPAASCQVGLSYLLDLDPVTYESLFSSATFEELAAVGESLPGGEALLSAGGAATFGPNTTDNSARGRREDQSQGVVGTNNDVIDLGVNWSGPACSLHGALVGTVDPEKKICENAGPSANQVCLADEDCIDDPACSEGVCNCTQVTSAGITLALALNGALVNQPPTANAGADQVVECNLPQRGRFTLTSHSQDPDGNLALLSWFRGSRMGPEVGFTPKVVLEQDLDTEVDYVLRAIDRLAQADEDTTRVRVVDTTAPVIACNAPTTFSPPDTPLSFTATATDVCDPTVTPELTGFRCYRINGSGKEIDTTHSCRVTLDGDRIDIRNSGGVGSHIVWKVRVADGSGNTSFHTCAAKVVVP